MSQQPITLTASNPAAIYKIVQVVHAYPVLNYYGTSTNA